MGTRLSVRVWDSMLWMDLSDAASSSNLLFRSSSSISLLSSFLISYPLVERLLVSSKYNTPATIKRPANTNPKLDESFFGVFGFIFILAWGISSVNAKYLPIQQKFILY